MALETDAERLEMLKALGDEQTATIGGTAYYGIFNNGHAESQDISGTAPSFLMRSSDAMAASVAFDTVATINAIAYKNKNEQADGEGMSLLILEEPD